MPAARPTWTDERLDGLSRHVEAGLMRVDEELRALRGELGTVRQELGVRIDGLGGRIDAQGERIDALHRAILQVGGGIVAAILVATGTLAVTLS